MKVVAYIMLTLILITAVLLVADPPKPVSEKPAAVASAAVEAVASAAVDPLKLQVYWPKELARAYEQNSVAADRGFKGQGFRVIGKVTDINTDASGRPYISMDGEDKMRMDPVFRFKPGQSDVLAKLRKGDQVQIWCVGAGDVLKTPVSDDCVWLWTKL